MSYAQAIRGNFLFVQGSAVGGTMPRASTHPIFTTDQAGLIACSSIVACAGLVRKTIEIRGSANQLAAFPVIVQGTVSEGANGNQVGANPLIAWFDLTAQIVAPGLVTIQVGAGAPQPLFYEPELTFLRIRSVFLNGAGVFPDSIGATMAAVYEGQCWDKRIKAAGLGFPEINRDYQAV